jgi:hypothetical protein
LTVYELVTKLATLPPDLPVYVVIYGNRTADVNVVLPSGPGPDGVELWLDAIAKQDALFAYRKAVMSGTV